MIGVGQEVGDKFFMVFDREMRALGRGKGKVVGDEGLEGEVSGVPWKAMTNERAGRRSEETDKNEAYINGRKVHTLSTWLTLPVASPTSHVHKELKAIKTKAE